MQFKRTVAINFYCMHVHVYDSNEIKLWKQLATVHRHSKHCEAQHINLVSKTHSHGICLDQVIIFATVFANHKSFANGEL